MQQERNNRKILVISGFLIVAIALIGWYFYDIQQDIIRSLGDESKAAEQALTRDLEQSWEEIEQLKSRIQQLAAEKSSLQNGLVEDENSRGKLQMELEAALEEKKQIEADLRAELQDMARVSSEMEKDLREQLAQQSKLEIDLREQLVLQSKLETDLRGQLARQSKLEIDLREQLAQRSKLEIDLREQLAQRSKLEIDLREQLAQRSKLETDLREQLARQSKLEIDLREQRARQEALGDQIDSVSSEKDQLLAELETEQQRARQLQRQIAEVSADADQKEMALSDREQAVSQLNQQLQQSREQQGLLVKRIEEINLQREQDARRFAELERRLKQELNESRFEISQLKNRMTVIKLTSEVLFSSGSARIKPAGQKVLSLIAETLNNYPDRAINIEGHTDTVPIGKKSRYTSNWELSTARALAAVNYLQQNSQIQPKRLKVVGYGEYRPVASNDTVEGRQLNRRIEIKLLPEF